MEVQGGKGLSEFVRFPYSFYRGDPHWVPSLRKSEKDRLRPEINPYFEHADRQLFVAYQNGVAKGRIAGIDDRRYNEILEDSAAFFGYFEAASVEVAQELYRSVQNWAALRGRSRLMGPFSPSQTDVSGFLIHGFGRDPGIMMAYNPPEYGAYAEQAGFRRAMDLLSWDLDLRSQRVQRLGVWAKGNLTSPAELIIRPLAMNRLLDELDVFRRIYSAAWENNWGFVPPTAPEVEYLGRQLVQIADPELTLIAEVKGRPVAIAVGIYDLNQILRGTNGLRTPRFLMRYLRRRSLIDRGRLYLLGVLPEFRGPEWRIFSLLTHELYRRALHQKCHRIELGWILEDNKSANKAAAWLGAEHTKTYRIYEKNLDTDRST